jgi:hypothetical protein
MNVLRDAASHEAASALNVRLVSEDTNPSAKEKEAAASCCPKNVSDENMCDSKNHGMGVNKGSPLLAALLMSSACKNHGDLQYRKDTPSPSIS